MGRKEKPQHDGMLYLGNPQKPDEVNPTVKRFYLRGYSTGARETTVDTVKYVSAPSVLYLEKDEEYELCKVVSTTDVDSQKMGLEIGSETFPLTNYIHNIFYYD